MICVYYVVEVIHAMKLFFGVYEYKDHSQKKSNYKRSIEIFGFANTVAHSLRSFLAIALLLLLLLPLLDTKSLWPLVLVCAAREPKPRFDGSEY